MRTLLLVLAVCACAAAMVSRERRALNTEEHPEATTTSSTTTTKKPFCAAQTPCSWEKYNKETKAPEITIPNVYCDCSPELKCQYVEDDTAVQMYVFRCRPPLPDDEEEHES